MADIPEPLDDLHLEGMERIRVARRMRDAATGDRTGPPKVWTTSIFDIIRFARRMSTTVKRLFVKDDSTLVYELTDGSQVNLGLVKGKDGATIRVGSGPPAADFGAPGDKYVDADTGDLYENKEA